jgi:hypothetical protein
MILDMVKNWKLCLLAIASLFPWIGYWNYPFLNSFTFTGVVLASLLVAGTLTLAYRGFLLAKKEFSWLEWGSWGLITAFYSIMLGSFYSGYRSVDDIFLVNDHIANGLPSGWHSFTYSLLIQALYFIFRQLFVTSIFQVMLISSIAALLLLLTRRSYLSALAIILATCWPLTQGIVFLINRDATFNLSLCFFVLALIARFMWRPKQKFSWNEILFFSMVLVMIADLRQDAKILLAAFVPVTYLLKLISKKDSLRFLASLIVISSIYFTVPPKLYQYSSYDPAYQTTAFVNPLSEVLHTQGKQALSKDEFEKIDKVFSVDALIQYYSPYDIFPFHQGGMRHEFSPEDFTQFKKTAQAVILRNPGIFVRNRLNMASSMLNTNFREDNIILDDAGPDGTPSFAQIQNVFHTPAYHPKNEFSRWYSFQMNSLMSSKNFFVRIVLVSYLPALLALIVLLIPPFTTAPIAFGSILLLSRVPVIFLLSPAGYLKYLASLWIGGAMLWIVHGFRGWTRTQ